MGRGGSRYGAGRPGWRVKAEHCYSLDVRRLAAEKMLRAGAWVWQWRNSDSGEVTASISIYGGADALRLAYRVNGRDAEQWVGIERSACGYGGSRPWFRCPGCGQRVAKLYLLQSRFACRHCQRLTYASRCEDEAARLWRRHGKLARKLGPELARPRYMHRMTYERIGQAIIDMDDRREAALAELFARLLPHLG